MNEKQKRIVDSLIGILTTPVARRKGIYISPEECEVWAKELEKYKTEKDHDDITGDNRCS